VTVYQKVIVAVTLVVIAVLLLSGPQERTVHYDSRGRLVYGGRQWSDEQEFAVADWPRTLFSIAGVALIGASLVIAASFMRRRRRDKGASEPENPGDTGEPR